MSLPNLAYQALHDRNIGAEVDLILNTYD